MLVHYSVGDHGEDAAEHKGNEAMRQVQDLQALCLGKVKGSK